MKLGCSIPFDISFASHSASFTSDLRPGTFLKCAGLTRQSLKFSSSSTFHTGIQYTPVDSIAISTISFSRSHAVSSCSSRVVAPKLLVSLSTVPPETIQRQATIRFLCTSIPAQRS